MINAYRLNIIERTPETIQIIQIMNNLTSNLHQKLGIIKWLVPLGLVLLVIAYEIGPSRWIYNMLGFDYHLVAEILLFGTVGPAVVFVLLEFLDRWIVEKEKAEIQAILLANAKKKELEVSQISDDTIQVLFGIGLLLTNFKSDQSGSSIITSNQIEVTEQALDEAIQRLKSQLLI